MSVQNKWLRAAGWLVAGPFGGVVLFYLLVLGVNWRDKPPSKAAQQLKRIYGAIEPPSDAVNAYVYGMGFSAQRYDDPQTIGLRRITWIRRQTESPESPARRDPAGDGIDYKSARSEAVDALAEKCSSAFVMRDCESALEQAGADDTVKDWVTSEEWLLERYRTLLERRWWVATVPYTLRTSATPPFATIVEGQRLLLARVWSIAGTGEVSAVRHLLSEDLRFWRRLSETSDNLLTKMIAVGGLRRHFVWSSMALRRLPPSAAASAMPPEWKTAITDTERQMWICFAGEWVFVDRLIHDTKEGKTRVVLASAEDGEGWMDRLMWRAIEPLLQPQDSSNATADHLLGLAQLAQEPYATYPRTLERMQTHARIVQNRRVPFARMYNVTGDWLYWSYYENYGQYAARVADVEGMRRLAVLVAELRGRNVPVSDVPKALAESTLRSPYTNEPFAWDAKASAVVFTGLEKGERGRHAFRY